MLACVVAAASGGNPTAPSSVNAIPYGTTTFVILVNPVINTLSQAAMPSPGSVRAGVGAAITDGSSATTGSSGVAVLDPVTAGSRTLTLSGSGLSGQLSLGSPHRYV